jgi:hypothetical protein
MRTFATLALLFAILPFLAADSPAPAPAADAKPAAAAPTNPAPATVPTPAEEKPQPQITPGKCLVPGDKMMRRIWGELVSLDLKARTGTFRNEGDDKIQSFIVLPYAELTHHAAPGDLQDYRIGERAIFRVHPNENGEWIWLTYIQDEMNFLNGHKEYYEVDEIDPAGGRLDVTDQNYETPKLVRAKGIILETDTETRYWRAGEPATFADIKVGDRLRTKTHGVGQGKTRRCWEVFLDDASLKKFQEEQREVTRGRMTTEGLPGYVDVAEGDQLKVTIFGEAGDLFGKIKPGGKVRVTPAGVDRKPTAEPIPAVIESFEASGRNRGLTLKLEQPKAGEFRVTELARVWLD